MTVLKDRPETRDHTNGHPPSGGGRQVENSRGSWWNPWGIAVAIAAAGLIVGGGIGVAAHVTTTKTVTTQAAVQTITQTVPGPVRTRTVVHVRRVPGPTTTVVRSVQAATPPATTASGGGAVAGGNTFTGNGSESLGTINVPTNSTLYWQCATCTATGMMIDSDLNFDGNNISVYSVATSGQSAVSAGRYTNVAVNADGPFTITIK